MCAHSAYLLPPIINLNLVILDCECCHRYAQGMVHMVSTAHATILNVEICTHVYACCQRDMPVAAWP